MSLPTPIRLPSNLTKELEVISGEMNISKSAIIRFCITAMLPEMKQGRLKPPATTPKADGRSRKPKQVRATA